MELSHPITHRPEYQDTDDRIKALNLIIDTNPFIVFLPHLIPMEAVILRLLIQ